MDILKYCKREEADPQYMWDLSALYKTEEEFEKAVKTIDLMADDFKKKLRKQTQISRHYQKRNGRLQRYRG